MEYTVSIRFVLNGEFSHSEDYDVEVPDNTPEDDPMDALMDAVRPILQDEFEGDDDWEDGNYNWTLYDYEKKSN